MSAKARRWRSALDATATVAIIAACGTFMWTMASSSGRQAPAKPTTTKPASAKATPPPPGEPVSTAGAAKKGSSAAQVAMLVFTDFQCPFCGRFARETLPTLEKEYVDTGKVMLVLMNDPLDRIHPLATAAAELAQCAASVGKFWDLHDLLFQNQARLEEPSVRELAAQVGVGSLAIDKCVAGGQARTIVSEQSAVARKLGISSTPTFLIGSILPNQSVKVVERMSGAQPIEKFKAAIDKVLRQPTKSGS